MGLTNLHVRGIDADIVKALKVRAHARGWSVATLIQQLLVLYADVQWRAKDDPSLEAILKAFGLETRQL